MWPGLRPSGLVVGASDWCMVLSWVAIPVWDSDFVFIPFLWHAEKLYLLNQVLD